MPMSNYVLSVRSDGQEFSIASSDPNEPELLLTAFEFSGLRMRLDNARRTLRAATKDRLAGQMPLWNWRMDMVRELMLQFYTLRARIKERQWRNLINR